MNGPKRDSPVPTVVLVCCQHGDERFGLRVYDWFRPRLKEFPGLKLILANPKAVEKRKRCIGQDLNRSYPGAPGGCYEERRAHTIGQAVRNADYVLDIHTSTTFLKPTPIVGNLSAGTKRILNLCSSENIVMMPRALSARSLFSVNPNSVAIETSALYARRNEARDEIAGIVRGLLDGERRPKRNRRVFSVAGTIPATVPMPVRMENFQYLPKIRGYAFLSGERAYKGLHHGFRLVRPRSVVL